MLTFLLSIALGSFAHAAEFQPILTPRGEKILITVSKPAGENRPVLVFAPGQSCGERELYDVFRREFDRRGWIVVRFQYAYCVKDPAKGGPSDDLSAEGEDFDTALKFARSLPGIDRSRIALVGKSLGSIVAYRSFRRQPNASSLALITPVCTYTTDDAGNPLPAPQPVFAESYPNYGEELRPVVLPFGDKDDLCLAPELFRALQVTHGNYLPMQFAGDHGFTVKDEAGKANEEATQANQAAVARFSADFIEATFRKGK